MLANPKPSAHRDSPDHRQATHSVACATALVGIALAGGPAHADKPPILAEYRQIQANYHAQLTQLADRLAAAGDDLASQQIRGWPIPTSSTRDWLFLPTAPQQDAAPSSNEPFAELRNQQADRLWKLAQRAAENKQNAFAVQLAHHTLRENPQHAAARQLLGWDEPDPPTKISVGRTRNKTYGWAAGDYHWARSAHFQLVTNCQQPVAVELIAQLETLHAVWRQLFADFAMTEAAFQRGWEQGSLPRESRRKQRVVLFANRDEYLRQLQRWEPQIALSQGVYRHQQRTAFFYADEPSSWPTVWHEVTHQLFHEAPIYGDATGAGANVGEAQDFWVIEGIAMFLESLRPCGGSHTGYYTVGGPDAERLQYARHRALTDQEYTPLAKLSMMGREVLQADPNIRQLYSQACGLTHFFMLGQDRRYRQAFLDYLREVYDRSQSAQSIDQRLQVSFAELDQQYAEFLSITDDDLNDLDSQTERLSLSNTRVTDAGITKLRELTNLAWLDVSATKLTDAALPEIARLTQLKTLWLAGTAVSDESIPHLAALGQLTELDLRGTLVTRQGRERLRAALPRLETLLPGD